MSGYREYLRVVFLAGVILAMVVANALEARGHTRDEIAEWVQAWALEADQSLNVRMVEDFRDFRERHAWYFWPAQTLYLAPSFGPAVPTDVEVWRPLVAQHFRPEDVDRALCLIWHESRGDPTAENPTSSATGLFQILAFWEDRYGLDRLDPAQNVQLAAIIRDAQGWAA